MRSADEVRESVEALRSRLAAGPDTSMKKARHLVGHPHALAGRRANQPRRYAGEKTVRARRAILRATGTIVAGFAFLST